MRRVLAAMVAAVALPAAAQPAAKVYAAGSLRAALTQAAGAFKAQGGGEVAFEFGPSGLLRERLAKGERADVFASANMEHPRAIAEAGLAEPVTLFARNKLCALAPEKAGLATTTVLDRLLDPAVRVATSTPKADPAGDYAWQVFERAEKAKPGAFDTLSKKALQLAGGPGSPTPPPGRSVYGMLMAEGRADVFLTYCTNALQAKGEVPGLAVTALPESLAVGAEYGLVVMKGATPAGRGFAEFLLGPRGQAILAQAGFGR